MSEKPSARDLLYELVKQGKGALESIHDRYLKLQGQYEELDLAFDKRNERDAETARKIILQDPAAFQNISADSVSVSYMVDRLIEMYWKK